MTNAETRPDPGDPCACECHDGFGGAHPFLPCACRVAEAGRALADTLSLLRAATRVPDAIADLLRTWERGGEAQMTEGNVRPWRECGHEVVGPAPETHAEPSAPPPGGSGVSSANRRCTSRRRDPARCACRCHDDHDDAHPGLSCLEACRSRRETPAARPASPVDVEPAARDARVPEDDPGDATAGSTRPTSASGRATPDDARGGPTDPRRALVVLTRGADCDVALESLSDRRWRCVSCAFDLDSAYLDDARRLAAHLREHLRAGHRVPESVFRRVEEL